MSRKVRTCRISHLFASLALLAAANVLSAQETASSTSPDSLADRLARAEEAIAALRQQIATQSEAGVQTKSGVRMEVSGRVLMNVFANTRRNNNFDVPYFVRPRLYSTDPFEPVHRNDKEQAGGFSMRQTSVAASITAPSVLRATFTGDIEADFFGGQMPSSGGRTFPLIRLRTARGILQWSHAQFLMGQETILISPQNPVSVASFGFPGFTGAGNLWLWLPQVRGTGEIGSRIRFALQAAVLAPTQGGPVGFFDTDPDSAELSRTPFVQGRVRVSWGQDETRGEIGFGVHDGRVIAGNTQFFAPPRSWRLRSSATALDFMIPITRWADLRGEAYRGKAVRGLGTGGVGQGITAQADTALAVRTKAGWTQLNLHPRTGMIVGSGYGVDDPEDRDLAPPVGRLKNVTWEAHFIWRFAGPLLVGSEVRQTTTVYPPRPFSFPTGQTNTNHHVNLALGFVF